MTAPALQRIDAAIIDLDGTMVDTLGDFARRWAPCWTTWGCRA